MPCELERGVDCALPRVACALVFELTAKRFTWRAPERRFKTRLPRSTRNGAQGADSFDAGSECYFFAHRHPQRCSRQATLFVLLSCQSFDP